MYNYTHMILYVHVHVYTDRPVLYVTPNLTYNYYNNYKLS